ncbi:hypothetical protein FHU38_001379 [Saccharomonospora amisosensis]|uniref:Uncharacterized protein n=1 Tax=Saccharomonospora amisosensis TaxID=1128677 RepID=A0A7X5ZQ73_9PSEU|nr:hypothetical protein [Saccharomonospora amisosensis]NIJ11035.1 hypothetical protein [Saccharomonospora amisosensis]
MPDNSRGKPETPDTEAGVPAPEYDPPKGGPHVDKESPSPADLAPGFGGTSRTRPVSSDEEDPPDAQR